MALIFGLLAWVVPTAFPPHSALDTSLRRVFLTPGFAAVAAGLVGLLGLAGQLDRRRRRLVFGTNQSLGAVRALRWRDFERWVGEAYRRQGYQVAETSDGADGGVDLVLRRAGETTYVQCKHWRATKVDVRPVRELYGVMVSGGAHKGVIVTAGRFTTAAHAETQGKPLLLIGGNSLLRLLGNAPGAGPEVVTRGAALGPASLRCPHCGSEMIRRTARKGSRAGKSFWGCSRFPSCRATVDIS
jgi:restriction system protein